MLSFSEQRAQMVPEKPAYARLPPGPSPRPATFLNTRENRVLAHKASRNCILTKTAQRQNDFASSDDLGLFSIWKNTYELL